MTNAASVILGVFRGTYWVSFYGEIGQASLKSGSWFTLCCFRGYAVFLQGFVKHLVFRLDNQKSVKQYHNIP